MRNVWIFFWSILALSSWAQKNIEVQYKNTEQGYGDVFWGKNIFNASYFLKDQILIESRVDYIREYQNLSLGAIARVDIVNPMQLCVFYKNFNTVVLLDKELAPIKTIQLSTTNPQLIPGFVGMSSQNRLWIWDDATNQLGYLSLQSLTFTVLTTAFIEPVKYRFSDVNYFYWISNANQLYYSDIYGKVNKSIVLPDFDSIQILSNNKIIYSKDNQLYYLDLRTDAILEIALSEKSISGFFFNTQILSIFTDLKIKNYLLTLP